MKPTLEQELEMSRAVAKVLFMRLGGVEQSIPRDELFSTSDIPLECEVDDNTNVKLRIHTNV